MKTEIRQNGKVILSSTDDISIPMIFKNLCGKNFSGIFFVVYFIDVELLT